MELRKIHSSTTPPGIQKSDAQRKISSTTPPNPAKPVKPTLPMQPKNPDPTVQSDDLGASILKGFAKLLGF
jgi:hypothetical protein